MWNVYSWKNYVLKHNPVYSNSDLIIKTLCDYNPLIQFNEIDSLLSLLNTLQTINQFILQIGECAEMFLQANEKDINLRLDFMESMAFQIQKNLSKEVIIIGRIAGQYAKPRSNDIEIVHNKEYPVYMGDMINSVVLDEDLRKPDAKRLLQAYDCSNFTLNIIRQRKKKIFSSHEALLLEYESALTRLYKHKYYNTSAHMLWLGERTRFVGSAHIQYLSVIENPVGIKISANFNIPDIISLINTLNPKNIRGKVILIVRMGFDNIIDCLPKLIDCIIDNNLEVLWMIDPMHGNTISYENFKTRKIDSICKEIQYFCDILNKKNVYIAGIHLEASYKNITECVGCIENNIIEEKDLSQNYESFCDPRLNAIQTQFILNLMSNIIQHKDNN